MSLISDISTLFNFILNRPIIKVQPQILRYEDLPGNPSFMLEADFTNIGHVTTSITGFDIICKGKYKPSVSSLDMYPLVMETGKTRPLFLRINFKKIPDFKKKDFWFVTITPSGKVKTKLTFDTSIIN